MYLLKLILLVPLVFALLMLSLMFIFYLEHPMPPAEFWNYNLKGTYDLAK